MSSQLDWNRCLGYWETFDHTVALPWWLVATAYPILIGARTVVWAGVVPVQVLWGAAEWTRSSPEAAPPRDARFVLVLRTFGRDGGLLVDSKRLEGRELLPRVRTLESLVVSCCRATGLDSVIGFHDRSNVEMPRGLRYFSAPDVSWQDEFQTLVRAASALVVFHNPRDAPWVELPLGDPVVKAWHLQEKVLLVAPPDLESRSKAVTNEVLALLDWPTPNHPPLGCHLGDDARLKGTRRLDWPTTASRAATSS